MFSIGFLIVGAITDYLQFKPGKEDALQIYLPANIFAVLLSVFLSVMQQEIMFIFSSILLKPFLFHAFRSYYKDKQEAKLLEQID